MNKGGRPLGSKNADSIAYQEFFVKRKVCIPEKEIWALNEAKKQYLFYRKKVTSGAYSPMEDNAKSYLKIYQELLKEIASRLYPKLKSIEHNPSSQFKEMSPEQKLEYLDQYRSLLLQEMNEDEDEPTSSG